VIEITVRKNGPYLVKGAVELKDADGNPIDTDLPFVLCRCGHSATKPFCDGSHKRVGFNDGSGEA
jgi:CDGSH-type Zn-finger protein